MSEIKVLSKEVSELIAAGEVIDRPASIIKELLENSIDAGASVITVEIKNGGRTYIRVTDNGKGIAADELPTAFLRHATSKISEKQDLDSIMTLGFRGEALASICAVGKVDVLTKRREDDYGTHYAIEGARETAFEESGCPDGTTFTVRDIFYNVPARLKFLKKDVSEGNAAADLVSKIAMSHPEVSFKFIRDNKTELLTAGDGKTYSAVYSVCGREFASSLMEVDYTYQGMRITGYTVKPLSSKPNRRFQFFFVNNRYIRSRGLAAALEEAYRNQIMVGKFPACVLFIDVPPNTVDVNVHPTKTEVRFSNEKLMHEAVFFAVKNSLLMHDAPNRMRLDNGRNFSDNELFNIPPQETGEQLRFSAEPETRTAEPERQHPVPAPVRQEISHDIKPSVRYSEPERFSKNVNEQVKQSEDTFIPHTFEKPEPEAAEPAAEPVKTDIQEDAFKFISAQSFEKKAQPVTIEYAKKESPKPVVVGELFKTFVIAQCGDEMILMDKHAAHERYIFEQIKDDANNLQPQYLLDPITVLLSYDEYDAICENLDKIAVLGFEVEPDDAPNIAIKGVPIIMGDNDPTELICELAKNLLDNKMNPQVEVFDDLYHSVACKAAIKANDNNSIAELQALLEAVYENDDIRYCPHGRPVIIKLTKRDIEKQFRRIV
ncbi:MAG: DNA mismatch repair endonuclease MutL [Ruminococcus sp.]|nr:DNA mismatch repair endonuclease MutL [Ruminococcus sp.]